MKRLISLTLGLLLSVNILLTVPVFALLSGSKEAVCKGIALSEKGSCAGAETQAKKVDSTIASALNLFSAVIGIIAVVMIMIGGIKYITSQGDSAQTNRAKNTILYAAIGLVVAALSQVIVRFVLSRFG